MVRLKMQLKECLNWYHLHKWNNFVFWFFFSKWWSYTKRFGYCKKWAIFFTVCQCLCWNYTYLLSNTKAVIIEHKIEHSDRTHYHLSNTECFTDYFYVLLVIPYKFFAKSFAAIRDINQRLKVYSKTTPPPLKITKSGTKGVF